MTMLTEEEKAAMEMAGKEADQHIDAFGQEEGTPQPAKKEEGNQQPDKKYAVIPDDHPTVLSLKQQIDDVKKEYGGNLAGQREVIKKLESKVEELTSGKGGAGGEGDADVLFNDIKWSKDLTKDERDDMSDTEIKQMDEIAKMKEVQNKMYAKQQEDSKKGGEAQQSNLQGWVKAEALTLAGNDVDVANKIIEAAKMLQLEGLDEVVVRERVKMAAGMVPTYKAPKEQPQKTGSTVKEGAASDDPFGVQKIIDDVQAKKKQGGNFNL